MAKNKKRKAGKGIKAPKPTKLPKKIAGMTIPKALRTEGGALVDLMRHPVIAGLAAAGLAALTDAIRENGKPDAGPATPERASRAAIDFGQGAAILGTMIAARVIEGNKGKR